MSRSLLARRVHIKPVEYPEVVPYKDAIRQSYWTHEEFNLTEDVQDFRVRVTPQERQVIERSMLAISQIEVKVKTFWSVDVPEMFPKPEIAAVGVTAGESEVRHEDAYSHLLELLGLNATFNRIGEIPAINDRMDYLDKYLSNKEPTVENHVRRIALFAVFIEYVSLFGLFYTIKSFYKHKNLFKGMANVVEATSKEEQLHGQLGFLLVNLLREEFPEYFEGNIDEVLREAVVGALLAEDKLLDWVFEDAHLGFVTPQDAKDFVLHRLQEGLTLMGFSGIMPYGLEKPVDDEKFRWFNEELIATKHYDFFNKRPTNYSRMSRSFGAEDLF